MNPPKKFSSPDELAEASYRKFVESGNKARKLLRPFRCLFSGGSTPVPFFRLLGARSSSLADLLRITEIFWVDERLVPPENSRSNYGEFTRIVGQEFLSSGVKLHRIPGELDSESAWVEYASELNSVEPFFFDLCFLGMGEDGHFASIFPDQSFPLKSERRCELTFSGTQPEARVTVTLKTLKGVAEVILLTNSNKKSMLLENVRRNVPEVRQLPVTTLVRELPQLSIWLT